MRVMWFVTALIPVMENHRFKNIEADFAGL